MQHSSQRIVARWGGRAAAAFPYSQAQQRLRLLIAAGAAGWLFTPVRVHVYTLCGNRTTQQLEILAGCGNIVPRRWSLCAAAGKLLLWASQRCSAAPADTPVCVCWCRHGAQLHQAAAACFAPAAGCRCRTLAVCGNCRAGLHRPGHVGHPGHVGACWGDALGCCCCYGVCCTSHVFTCRLHAAFCMVLRRLVCGTLRVQGLVLSC